MVATQRVDRFAWLTNSLLRWRFLLRAPRWRSPLPKNAAFKTWEWALTDSFCSLGYACPSPVKQFLQGFASMAIPENRSRL